MNKLLALLKTKKEMTFQQLKEALGVSDPTLAEYIKTLENQKRIENFLKSPDRRHRWYKIKLESAEEVDAQIGRYEAIKFIEGIQNPLYIYKPSPNGQKAIAAFAQADPSLRKPLDMIASAGLRFLTAPLRPGQKIAVVLMAEGRKKEK